MDQQKEKVRCESCGSAFVYIRIRENSVVCRSCGNIQLLTKQNKKEE